MIIENKLEALKHFIYSKNELHTNPGLYQVSVDIDTVLLSDITPETDYSQWFNTPFVTRYAVAGSSKVALNQFRVALQVGCGEELTIFEAHCLFALHGDFSYEVKTLIEPK